MFLSFIAYKAESPAYDGNASLLAKHQPQMCFSLFLALSAAMPNDDTKKIITGNWTATFAPVEGGESLVGQSYHVRIQKLNDYNFTIGVYEDNESTTTISEFVTFFEKTGVMWFGETNETANMVGLFANLRTHPTATGRFGDYVYNFIISGLTKAQLDLIDTDHDTFLTINFLKDIDRTPAPLWKKYGQYIVLGAVFIASQGFSMWSQRKMMQAGQQCPVQPKAPKEKKEESKVEEVDEKEKKVEEVDEKEKKD